MNSVDLQNADSNVGLPLVVGSVQSNVQKPFSSFKTLPPHTLSIHQFVYLFLTCTFITCLIVADVVGVKIFEVKLPFSIFGFKYIEHTCGMLTFPITFLLGDIINEYYGPKATKTTVYIGLIMSILVFGVMNLAQALPYLDKPFNGNILNFIYELILNSNVCFSVLCFCLVTPDAFNMVFGSAKLMYVASIRFFIQYNFYFCNSCILAFTYKF